MNNFEPEKNSIELAARCVEQIRECLEMAREKAEADPQGAECLLRPAARLGGKLLTVQAALEALTEHIQHPSAIAVARR